MQVTEFNAAELAKFRDKMKPVIDKHAAVVGRRDGQGLPGRTDGDAQVAPEAVLPRRRGAKRAASWAAPSQEAFR